MISNQKKIKENTQFKVEITKLNVEISKLTKQLEDKNSNSINEQDYKELKKKNVLLEDKIKEAKEKISKANTVIKKAKKFGVCLSYISELIKEMKPSNDKENYLFYKLKTMVENEEKEKEKEKKND